MQRTPSARIATIADACCCCCCWCHGLWLLFGSACFRRPADAKSCVSASLVFLSARVGRPGWWLGEGDLLGISRTLSLLPRCHIPAVGAFRFPQDRHRTTVEPGGTALDSSLLPDARPEFSGGILRVSCPPGRLTSSEPSLDAERTSKKRCLGNRSYFPQTRLFFKEASPSR